MATRSNFLKSHPSGFRDYNLFRRAGALVACFRPFLESGFLSATRPEIHRSTGGAKHRCHESPFTSTRRKAPDVQICRPEERRRALTEITVATELQLASANRT